MNLFFKSILIWILIALVETLHGIIRQKFLAKKVGDLRSRQIGVFTGSILIFFITKLTFNWISISTSLEAYFVGTIWLILMLLFEFLVGHFVFHFPWKWLFEEYNVKKGKLLLFGMIFLFFVPKIVLELNR